MSPCPVAISVQAAFLSVRSGEVDLVMMALYCHKILQEACTGFQYHR